jgi:hypothetical protein
MIPSPAIRTPQVNPVQADTVKTWNVPAERISADPLGQFYMVRSGVLIKYNPNLDSAFSWSEPQTGRITMIDTGDPMKILVYQKDFNLLRFLNNRLATLSGPIRLDDLGLTAPLALGIARQGGFWVLDGTTFRIRQFDEQLKPVVESPPLDLPAGRNSQEYRLIESGDRIYLLVPGREIQVFDLFANLIKKIPLNVLSFNVYGDLLLLVYPDRITLRKDAVTPEETLFGMTGGDIREACLLQNKLCIKTGQKVIVLTR